MGEAAQSSHALTPVREADEIESSAAAAARARNGGSRAPTSEAADTVALPQPHPGGRGAAVAATAVAAALPPVAPAPSRRRSLSFLRPSRLLVGILRPAIVTWWQRDGVRIGGGSYGDVYARWAAVGLREAARPLLLADKVFATYANDALPREVVRELHPLLTLPQHPHVASVVAVVTHARRIHVLMPLATCNLRRLLRTERPNGLAPQELHAVTVQLLRALAHLHRHGFLHRDVKLENVLVDDHGRVLLGDLGLCRFVGGSRLWPHRRGSGTDGGGGAPVSCGSTPAAAAAPLRAGAAWDDADDGAPGVAAPQTPRVCTLWTRAPEMCLCSSMLGSRRALTTVASTYGAASDVWSLGATLLAAARGDYALTSSVDGGAGDFLVKTWRLLGKPPDGTFPLQDAAAANGHAIAALPSACFPHYGMRAVAAARLREAAGGRDDLPDAFFHLLARMMDVLPHRRATVSRALRHAYVRGVSGTEAAAVREPLVALPIVAQPPRPPPLTSSATTLEALLPIDTLWVAPSPVLDALAAAAAPASDTAATASAPHQFHAPPVYAEPAPNYMAAHGGAINAVMRATLLDWLMEVVRWHNMQPSAFFDAAQLLDAYLAKRRVDMYRLQLVGMAALSLVAKTSETAPPSPMRYIDVCDRAYTAAQLSDAEMDMLFALHGVALPPPFLRLYDKLAVWAVPSEATAALAASAGAAHVSVWRALPEELVAAAAVLMMHPATLPWAAANVSATACAAAALAAALQTEEEAAAAPHLAAVQPCAAARAMLAALRAELQRGDIRARECTTVWQLQSTRTSLQARAAYSTWLQS